WSRFDRSGNRCIGTSVHQSPTARNTGCTKVSRRYLKGCKWVKPFPRARMRLAPQGKDMIRLARGQPGQYKRVPCAPRTDDVSAMSPTGAAEAGALRIRWSAAPLVVDADAHDVVGQPAGLGHDGPRRRCGERLLGLAEVEVEIFELGAPAA